MAWHGKALGMVLAVCVCVCVAWHGTWHGSGHTSLLVPYPFSLSPPGIGPTFTYSPPEHSPGHPQYRSGNSLVVRAEVPSLGVSNKCV